VTEPIPINLAVEDDLSEAVIRRMLAASLKRFAIGSCYSRGGFGYLKRTIRGFNAAAEGTPFLVLTDLDSAACAPELIRNWLPVSQHANLLFRVAVREVEAWLLAHRDAIARHLRVSVSTIPPKPEAVGDAKAALIQAASASRSRDIREDIVPPKGSARKQGPNYNSCLIQFVAHAWDPTVAAASADSLRRALDAITRFSPTWASSEGSGRRPKQRR